MKFASDFFSSGFERIDGVMPTLAEASRQLASKAGETVRFSGSAIQALSIALAISATSVVGVAASISPASNTLESSAISARSTLKSLPSDEEFTTALMGALGSQDVLLRATGALRKKIERLDQKQSLDELANWRTS